MRVIEFDPAKDAANLDKHGLTLADAELVYFAPAKLTLTSRVPGETRLMDVAWVVKAKLVLVLVYVERGDMVRAISLRRASRQERRLYENYENQQKN